MYQHTIIIHGSQSEDRRIALHKDCQSIEDIQEFMSLSSKLNKMFEHLTFGFHHIQSLGQGIESVSEYDPFFRDIDFYEDYDEFVRLIKKDIYIKPIDIVKILLSKREYSHLEIQKLIYFVYCEYLDMYDEEIFTDDFEAWEYGPVIPDIYYSLKKYGKSKIYQHINPEAMTEIQSRLIKFPKSDRLIKVINKTIEKYSHLGAFELVKESHITGGPWDKIYQDGLGDKDIIEKDLIRDYVMMN